uniref:Uncharacterized protein n=1 Tax=Oryza rufipogon TaxID=4529 RepID=A0A0E0RH71_ORYRU
MASSRLGGPAFAARRRRRLADGGWRPDETTPAAGRQPHKATLGLGRGACQGSPGSLVPAKVQIFNPGVGITLMTQLQNREYGTFE